MNKMIVCTDGEGGIGLDNNIPWHSRADFAYFKEYTSGSKILMGYNTWVSLPQKSRPLPDRHNIVVTSRPLSEEDKLMSERYNVQFIHKDTVRSFMAHNNGIIVIGGAWLYQQCMDFVDEISMSTLDTVYGCDRFFQYPESEFELHSKTLLSDLIVSVSVLRRKFRTSVDWTQ